MNNPDIKCTLQFMRHFSLLHLLLLGRALCDGGHIPRIGCGQLESETLSNTCVDMLGESERARERESESLALCSIHCMSSCWKCIPSNQCFINIHACLPFRSHWHCVFVGKLKLQRMNKKKR